MKKQLINVAFCYDFDGTLAAGNMQEYGFMTRLGIKPEDFWRKVDTMAKENGADNISCYMKCMLDAAKAQHMAFKREDFVACGKDIPLFKGVTRWFDRINAYALERGILISHYLISSGLREIAEGTAIAGKFKQIFASSFLYNEYGEADWPGLVVNFTGKTQYLYRINKGCLDVSDNKSVNNKMPENERPVPFSHMLYFGDGDTDVPCMSMLKRWGGHSVAVFQPYKHGARNRAQKYINEERAQFMAPADYSAGKAIDRYAKALIDKLAADAKLSNFE